MNKSEESPDGVEIEVVEPENELEQNALAYLLAGYVRDAVGRGNFNVELPENFTINYQREGSFILIGGPASPDLTGPNPTYYNPGKPVAVLAIQTVGNRFDVVYGQLAAPAEDQTAATNSA